MENPPAPKMPELGSLVVERTSESTNHGTASGDGGGGGIFEWSKPPKSARDCGNLHMFHALAHWAPPGTRKNMAGPI